MSSIQIKLKDGTVRDFRHEGRAGGSFTKRLRYEVGFVVIEDEYGHTTSIPTADIAEVKTAPERYY